MSRATSRLNPQEQQQLAALLARAGGTSIAAAATPVGPYLHGGGGLLSAFGPERGIVNAMVLPDNDLRRVLPWFKSATDYAIFNILTEQTASTGTDAAAVCDTGKTPGQLKVCAQVLPFGEIRMVTDSIQINRIGRRINRAEMADYQLIGDPLASMPVPPEARSSTLLDEKKARIRSLFFAMDRDYAAWDFSGVWVAQTPTTNATRPYYGLETQINTGHRDAFTSPATLCPAADSKVDATLSGLSWSANAAQIVRRITDTVRYLENLARRTGLNPVEFGLAMQYAHFVEACYYWPLNYFTLGAATGPSGVQSTLSGSELTAMRDDMLQNNYLVVGGKRYPVITSEYPTETNPSTGVYASDLYIVPLRSPRFSDTQGWITYYEYLDYNQTIGSAAQSLLAGMSMDDVLILGDGRFLLYEIAQTGPCWQWGAITEPRIVCKAPFLAARFTGIRYTDGVPQRSGLPGDANYAGGGVTGYATPSYLSPV